MPEFMIPFVVIHCIGLVIVAFISIVNLSLHNNKSRNSYSYEDDRKVRIATYRWFKWSLLWEVPAGIAFYNMISGARKDIRDVEEEELKKL